MYRIYYISEIERKHFEDVSYDEFEADVSLARVWSILDNFWIRVKARFKS